MFLFPCCLTQSSIFSFSLTIPSNTCKNLLNKNSPYYPMHCRDYQTGAQRKPQQIHVRMTRSPGLSWTTRTWCVKKILPNKKQIIHNAECNYLKSQSCKVMYNISQNIQWWFIEPLRSRLRKLAEVHHTPTLCCTAALSLLHYPQAPAPKVTKPNALSPCVLVFTFRCVTTGWRTCTWTTGWLFQSTPALPWCFQSRSSEIRAMPSGTCCFLFGSAKKAFRLQ